MTAAGVNEQILRAVFDLTGEDVIVRRFVVEALFEEHRHPGQWWFKDHYKKRIREHSQEWSAKE